MATQKLGIGAIEINKRFDSKEQAYKYARRLQHFIKYTCEKNKDNGYLAQAMIVVSEMKKDVSQLRYVNSGKRGRPKKELYVSDFMANNWYEGNYKTDWHLHILIVSKPSYAFRNKIKDYIDRRWFDIEQIYEVEPFDYSKLDSTKKVYKVKTNVGIADYFIKQSSLILFCNYNFGEEENLKYTLKEYYREYMKVDSNKRRLYSKHKVCSMSEEKFLLELNKIEKRYKDIFNYFWSITKEDNIKQEQEYMEQVRHSRITENYNKVQKRERHIPLLELPF